MTTFSNTYNIMEAFPGRLSLLFCVTILASSQKNAHSFLLPSAQTISLRNNGMGLLYSSPRSNFNFASSTQLYSTTPTPSQNEVVSFSTENKGQPALLEAIAKFSPSTTIDACRIFHGRGGLYPGADHLTLDYYPPVFLLTSFEALPDEEVDVYSRALKDLWEESAVKNADEVGTEENEQVEVEGTISDGEITELKPIPFTWVYQCRAERKNSTTQLMSGIMPNPHIVTENNGKNKFLVHLLKGQNHGLFLDMASGRKWLQTKCEEDDVVSVLNLFAYTCAFSIAALNGGADTVVNVDMSRGALKTGQRSHEINGLTQAGGAKFLAHDIFKTWGKMKKMGNPKYDAVIVDPPSYQKGSFVASKDYIKVIRRLDSLLNPDGYALLCLNAPELNVEFLHDQVIESAPGLSFVERLENPASFASAFPERALKVLVFQYRPAGIE